MGVYARLRIATESYGIPVGDVIEVADLGELTVVPGAPREILGVRNLRRQILPVIDLALVIGVRGAQPKRLLVAEAEGVLAGFAVDEVTDVGELPDPAEETESDFLVGAMLYDGDLIGVIDVTRIFGSLARADR